MRDLIANLSSSKAISTGCLLRKSRLSCVTLTAWWSWVAATPKIALTWCCTGSRLEKPTSTKGTSTDDTTRRSTPWTQDNPNTSLCGEYQTDRRGPSSAGRVTTPNSTRGKRAVEIWQPEAEGGTRTAQVNLARPDGLQPVWYRAPKGDSIDRQLQSMTWTWWWPSMTSQQQSMPSPWWSLAFWRYASFC